MISFCREITLFSPHGILAFCLFPLRVNEDGHVHELALDGFINEAMEAGIFWFSHSVQYQFDFSLLPWAIRLMWSPLRLTFQL